MKGLRKGNYIIKIKRARVNIIQSKNLTTYLKLITETLEALMFSTLIYT